MLTDIFIRNYVALHNSRIAGKGLKPLPVDFWLQQKEKLRRFSSKQDMLTPSARVIKSKGSDIPVPELQPLFKGVLLGTWTLDQATLTLLWNQLLLDKPRIIMECGSGVSTLMFSQYFKTYQTQGKLVSFEQDAKEKQRIEGLLEKHQLTDFASILHTPVDETGRYRFDAREIANTLQGQKAVWLMIDGPSGPSGCRDNIIGDLSPFLSKGTSWWMDDSFRDGELAFLKAWDQDGPISVHGIYPIGKGLSSGIIA